MVLLSGIASLVVVDLRKDKFWNHLRLVSTFLDKLNIGTVVFHFEPLKSRWQIFAGIQQIGFIYNFLFQVFDQCFLAYDE